MRKLLVGFALVLVISAGLFLRFHHPSGPLEVVYAGNREITLWSTTAQVRSQVATVHYGERLEVLNRLQDQVQVKTSAGAIGWASGEDLLSSELWQAAKDLESRAAKLPVEANGHTKGLSNLHIEPARDATRIRQIDKGIPVQLFERQAVEMPPSPAGASPEAKPTSTKKEDWWLVRAHLADQASVTGWILGRFIDLDIPEPLPDYASSAAMHITAWFELNRVIDTSGEAKPQYLVVGTRGPEGQPCDFTLMRVYTWSTQKERYETAFVESDVCGRLPIKVAEPRAPGGDAAFSFQDWSKGPSEQRTYTMHQTIVRQMGKRVARPVKRQHVHP
jgi:hypothetical protein